MANKLKCKDCPYYWADNDPTVADLPYCHYQYDDGYAPCEIEDREKETEDDQKRIL